MIKYGLSNRYKVDPYGTEEILSGVSNSVAPKLTIDYGDEVQEAEFTIRPTKGSLDTNISPVAVLNSIKGNTIAWNQLCSPATYQMSNLTAGTYTGIDNNGISLVSGHKYYVGFGGSSISEIRLRDSVAGIATKFITNGVYSCVNSTTGTTFFQILPSATSADFYIQFIDLTLIYGAGNEPTTPEAFEADYYKWSGKQLTYEEYDEGSLRSCKMSGVKTVGFNQWDEIAEEGMIDQYGQNAPAEKIIRSKNYTEIIPDTDYYVKTSSGVVLYVHYYDANKQHIESSSLTNTYFDYKGNQITHTPSNARYMRFRTTGSYGSTYKGDICFNLSNATRNGEYEAYKPNYCNIPVTTLKGKLNGEGSSVVVFPDGIKSAGNARDEIKVENGVAKAIKRVGSVDLGTLTWQRDSSRELYTFYAPIQGVKFDSSIWNTTLECARYVAEGASTSDKTISIFKINSNIYVADSAHSTAPTLQDNWLDGVILYYELATPEEYIIDDVNVEKVMLGNTEVTKVYLGNQLIFEESN